MATTSNEGMRKQASTRRSFSPATEAALDGMREIVRTNNREWRTLPPHAYHSEEIFELEKEKIFRAGWVLIGRADQVSTPGSYMSVDVVGDPLVMARDKAGTLRVLSRVCRHRWMTVCSGSGTTNSFVCPYHAWTYGLDGSLIGAPAMDKTPCFDRADFGLLPVRYEVWEGFVFVNIDGKAESLGSRLAPLAEALKEFGLSRWRTVKTRDYGICPWDWKVFQDNGECYHHLGAHRQTFELDFPAMNAWDSPNNGHYTLIWCGPREETLVTGDDGRPIMKTMFKPVSGLTDIQRTNLCLYYVLPNYFVYPSPDLCLAVRSFPLAAGRVHMLVDYILPPHVLEEPDYMPKIDEIEQYVEKFNAEDTEVCKEVQRGLESSAATSGPLSRLEGHNRDMALWVARMLTS